MIHVFILILFSFWIFSCENVSYICWFALDFLNEGSSGYTCSVLMYSAIWPFSFCVKKWSIRHLFLFLIRNLVINSVSSSIGVLFVPRYVKKAARFVWCAIWIDLFDRCLAGGSSYMLWSSRLWCPSTCGDKLTTLFNLLLICWPRKMRCAVIPVFCFCFFPASSVGAGMEFLEVTAKSWLSAWTGCRSEQKATGFYQLGNSACKKNFREQVNASYESSRYLIVLLCLEPNDNCKSF